MLLYQDVMEKQLIIFLAHVTHDVTFVADMIKTWYKISRCVAAVLAYYENDVCFAVLLVPTMSGREILLSGPDP